MFSTISKWGNSLGVRIPRAIAEQIGVSEGESVELVVEDNHLLVQKVYQLKNLLKQITPENTHSEITTGTAVGKESW